MEGWNVVGTGFVGYLFGEDDAELYEDSDAVTRLGDPEEALIRLQTVWFDIESPVSTLLVHGLCLHGDYVAEKLWEANNFGIMQIWKYLCTGRISGVESNISIQQIP